MKSVVRALVCALFGLSAVAPEGSAAGAPVLDQLAWSTDSAQPSRFLAVHGRRSAVFGYPEQGLEAWAYPVQIVRSFAVAFRPADGSSDIDGRAILRRVIYRPESVTRVYVGSDFVVRERIFVPLDAAGAIVSYEVNGQRPVDVVVRFIPVLDLMWPAALGGQEAQWDGSAMAYRLSEPTHRFAAIVGSPDVVSHDDTLNYAETVGRSGGLAFTIRPRAPANMTRVVIAGAMGGTDAGVIGQHLLADAEQLEKSAEDHYAGVLGEALQVETPDPQVNRAVAWAEIALEEAWVCNPDLGCGTVAGYGASRKARRPQYDWFFAGDGMVAVGGLLASGRYERAREELELILKFRNRASGMIWHELTQSAAYIDWDSYPYKFVHVDLTFDFLDSMSRYLSVTGDRGFVSRNWDAVSAAYRYCRSLLNPKDGLPRIPAGKQGMNEQDVLSDDLTLSASWVSAAEAFANLAAATGHDAEAAQARRAGQQAREAAGRRYWDARQNVLISAYSGAGAPLTDPDAQPVAALRSSLFTSQQRDSLLDQLASYAFQADWGTRSKSSNARTYLPNSYASGSVWGLGSAGAASAFWAAHRPATAFPIWSALVSWMSLDSLGHMPETLAGDYYHEELESVPEQTWSSAAFLSATVSGLLGLRVEGGSNRVTFAPHLPQSWDGVTVRHVHAGTSELSLRMIQTDDEIQLHVQNTGAPVQMVFEPELPLGASLGEARVAGRQVSAAVEQSPQDVHARAQFEAPSGSTSLTIRFGGGVRVIPIPGVLLVGESSTADKIASVVLKNHVLTIGLDHLTSRSSSLEIRTPWTVRNVDGATLEPLSVRRYRVIMPSREQDARTQGYRREKVVLSFSDPGEQAPQP